MVRALLLRLLARKPKIERSKFDDIRLSGQNYSDDLPSPFKAIWGRNPPMR